MSSFPLFLVLLAAEVNLLVIVSKLVLPQTQTNESALRDASNT